MSERTDQIRRNMDYLSRNSSSIIMYGLLLGIAALWCAAVARPGGVVLALACFAVLLGVVRVRGNAYVASAMLFAVLAWPVQPFEISMMAGDGGPRVVGTCNDAGTGSQRSLQRAGDAECVLAPAASSGFEPGWYLVW